MSDTDDLLERLAQVDHARGACRLLLGEAAAKLRELEADRDAARDALREGIGAGWTAGFQYRRAVQDDDGYTNANIRLRDTNRIIAEATAAKGEE